MIFDADSNGHPVMNVGQKWIHFEVADLYFAADHQKKK